MLTNVQGRLDGDLQLMLRCIEFVRILTELDKVQCGDFVEQSERVSNLC